MVLAWSSALEKDCALIQAESSAVSYGWGMIPAAARIGESEWTTSLFPVGSHRA
ncbi:MAG TPA: DUF1905 domain-containing protein [Umezawaea sp.]|nr:DUF1905 domain-containing protein [Umezawaea sp.]